MIMYNPNLVAKRSAVQQISVETVIFDQMSPNCDPELEDSKTVFLHNILDHDVASPYQVWVHKVQQQRRYHSDEHSLEF